MEAHGNDGLLEEIDKELRAIDKKLKKALSKTDALLKEQREEKEENEDGRSDTEE